MLIKLVSYLLMLFIYNITITKKIPISLCKQINQYNNTIEMCSLQDCQQKQTYPDCDAYKKNMLSGFCQSGSFQICQNRCYKYINYTKEILVNDSFILTYNHMTNADNPTFNLLYFYPYNKPCFVVDNKFVSNKKHSDVFILILASLLLLLLKEMDRFINGR